VRRRRLWSSLAILGLVSMFGLLFWVSATVAFNLPKLFVMGVNVHSLTLSGFGDDTPQAVAPLELRVVEDARQDASAVATGPPAIARTATPSSRAVPTPAPTSTPAPTQTATPTPAPSATPTPTPTPRGPTASFAFSPSNPVTGSPVTFDGRASSCAAGPCTYKWTDDGCPSPCGDLGTGPTLVFTFTDIGTKFVRLTISDALGRSASVEHNVVVAGPLPTPTPAGPTASFTYNPSSPAAGSPVTFDAHASSCAAGPCTYKWTDDGCPSPCGDLGTGLTLAFTFTDVGTKYVRLTVIDALGRSATVEHNVAVH
jgi:hypothetical protein